MGREGDELVRMAWWRWRCRVFVGGVQSVCRVKSLGVDAVGSLHGVHQTSVQRCVALFQRREVHRVFFTVCWFTVTRHVSALLVWWPNRQGIALAIDRWRLGSI